MSTWVRLPKEKFQTNNNINVESNFDSEVSIIDEGTQNSKDNPINEVFHSEKSLEVINSNNIPEIKIKRVKIPWKEYAPLIDDEYMNWAKNSKAQEKYFWDKQVKKRSDVETLLFEDFNTTGIKGGPTPHKLMLENNERNDWYAFMWNVGSPETKGQNKGGSIGIGRLTFALSSEIKTFFSYTQQNYNSHKNTYFAGLTIMGHDSKDEFLDPIARFGVRNEGDKNNKWEPISGAEELENLRNLFKLERKKGEGGTSMIVPFVRKEITKEDLIKRIIDRYRIGLYLNHFKITIEGEIVSKQTLKSIIKKYLPDELESHEKYFEFIDQCGEIEKNKNYFEPLFEKDNPSEIKLSDFNEDDREKIIQSYEEDKTLGFRIPLKIEKKRENRDTDNSVDSEKSYFDIYIKKTNDGLGRDDILRNEMSVSGLRNFQENNIPNFGLINIQHKEASAMFRSLETPNHKFFLKDDSDFKQIYHSYKNQRSLVQSSLKSIKRLIEEEMTDFDSEAADDFFDFGSGSEDGKSKKRRGRGVTTPFQVPVGLFNNPTKYQIIKYSKGNLNGFKIFNLKFKEECKKTIDRIDDFLAKNEEKKEFTKRNKKDLLKQKEKVVAWLENKNLDQLFPSTLYITCLPDIEGHSKKKSQDFYNPKIDYDFSNKLKHKIEHKKIGDIGDIIYNENKIKLSINGPDYSFEFLTDVLNNKTTKQAVDMNVTAFLKPRDTDGKDT